MIEFVAMATPEDLMANAEYIRYADQVCHVPGGSNINNYANVNLIVQIAQQYEVDAVWAGWGHASENPRLPNTLDELDIVFVGPPGAPMYALGDKIGSTIIAQSAKVPTIAWNGQELEADYKATGSIPQDLYDSANVTSVEMARKEIEKLGVPVMIKASEGGGGKGIRVVDDYSNVEAAFRQVQSELPGSPIFIMRLASAARHLEVQLLADQYGEAIALSGRDCSVQRRHQKILEEGPPVAAKPDVWREMERAAVRLAKEVGYVNAGTVEYLYDANDKFFFLELNPRLQVEHPVTEMITGMNLPASQLMVAMGIPLHRIPEVRRFYKCKDLYGAEPIDFDKGYREGEEYEDRTHGHTIAARITAENPFTGFQPTSGQITEINFRSSRNVWGYFSVDSSGRVHEFADSQIGHVFAWGEDRETARRNLAIALNDLSIRGEIRTTIEYLKDLIEVPEYRDNKFDTTWLDARIKRNVAINKIDPLTVVMVGAACTAHKQIVGTTSEYLAMLERGQLPPPALLDQTYNFELIYENVKYVLCASRSGEIQYRITCNNSSVDVELRCLADGGFLVLMGGKSHVAYAKDDIGAQRYMIDGQTCLFADEYDPTQMRAQMGGKLLRFLVEDGATIEKNQPYAEIEVMKMNMTLSAQEAGKITLVKPEGSVMEPGDMICTMELADPSKVQKAELFEGTLPKIGGPRPQALDNMPHHSLERAKPILENVMKGYRLDDGDAKTAIVDIETAMNSPLLPVLEVEGFLSCNKNSFNSVLVNKVEELAKNFRASILSKSDCSLASAQQFAQKVVIEAEKYKPQSQALIDLASQYSQGLPALHVDILGELLLQYVEVETTFAELELSDAAEKDDVLQELRAQNAGDLNKVMSYALSYFSRGPRDSLAISLLETLERIVRANPTLAAACGKVIQRVAGLRGNKTTYVALEARQLLLAMEHSYAEALDNIVTKVKAVVAGDASAQQALVSSTEPVLTYLMDIVSSATYEKQVRKTAMELYVERVYASFTIVNCETTEDLNTDFVFFSEATDAVQFGSSMMTSVSSFDDLTSILSHQNPMSLIELNETNASEAETSSIGMDIDQNMDAEPVKPLSRKAGRPSTMAKYASEIKARSESNAGNFSNIVAPFVHRSGSLGYVASMDDLKTRFASLIKRFEGKQGADSTNPVFVMHIILTADFQDEESFADVLASFMQEHKELLQKNSIRRVTFAVIRSAEVHAEQQPIVAGHGGHFFTFRSSSGFGEDRLVRNIETPLAFQLDLQRLANFNIQLVPVVKNSGAQTVHVYLATPKNTGSKKSTGARFFVRALVRQAAKVKQDVGEFDAYPGPERVFVQALTALEAVQDKIDVPKARKNHIFMNVLSDSADINPEYVEGIIRTLHRRYAKRLIAQNVVEFEIRVNAVLAEGAPSIPIRVIASNPTGFALNIDSYVEATDPSDPRDSIFYSISEGDGGLGGALAAMGLGATDTELTAPADGIACLHGKPLNTPYHVADAFDERRTRATAAGTTFVYDFPDLFRKTLEFEWRAYLERIPEAQRPSSVKIPNRKNMVEVTELVLDDEMAPGTPLDESSGLVSTTRPSGTNSIGMVAWKLILRTPQYPEGRRVIVIANDITTRAGSFGTREDELFFRASKYARENGLPRLYIAANSGARIGMADEVKRAFQVEWINAADPTKGFEYIYIEDDVYDQLGPDGRKSVIAEKIEGTNRWRIEAIVGESPDLGVENLRGSGKIAGETARAYEEGFTLSYVSGRSVGIGAYLIRLGQRTIQKGKNAPILLTGYSALNSLMGRDVYTSNLQLGGPKVMFANGVSHLSVRHDLEGVSAMVNWLSYVPECAGAALPLTALPIGDNMDRLVQVHPKDLGEGDYDPRLLLTGITKDDQWVPGFFDRDSFTETLSGWAKTVITGRARLGQVPMGVIISEVRTVEARSPADPAAPDSQERIWNQAGQVWFPDSAYKTAQAISDFNKEGLPLMLFANWRGFSGGQRDMFDQVLKYGAFIVDELVQYKQPVFVYIPPFGELRGGAWVVVDPTINESMMEMYAAPEARGGVLEPAGAVSIKFRAKDMIATAHRVDEKLIALDNELKTSEDPAAVKLLIEKREKLLLPIFHQIAIHFGDLHDRPGRMLAKGVIRSIVPWEKSRTFFLNRLRRRLAEIDATKKIESVLSLHSEFLDSIEPKQLLEQVFTDSNATTVASWEDDKIVYEWLVSAEGQSALEAYVDSLRADAIANQVVSLGQQDSKAILKGLMGLIGKLQESGQHEERAALVQTLRRGIFLLQ